MDVKKILFAMIVCALFVGVCAAGVNDFKVDSSYSNVYSGTYYSAYANANQDTGMAIYQNVNDDVYDDMENDDVLDHIIHHDGREYIMADDDLQITVNADHIANFTDYDHATHGVSEVINANGQQYIVVVWAKDNGGIDNAKAMSTLKDFNKNNGVEAVAF